ncbi:hypothetical protein OIE66_15810 [Nonomuraea sp. NBC_01738]|uniref:hypothetical protein n=1 Tax=Nonomuraea sp. NBC_01738 TaxID=2976003 RepID=UPI002E0E549A|nr:hypothetical protein OIE66_15810 [Nonomuraea sp. NBC_01738]
MSVDEPPVVARTLAEAYVHLDLVLERPGSQDVAPPVEGADGWVVATGGHRVAVPYAGELAARKAGLMFGEGRSALIDCGQWAIIGAVHARRALERDVLGGGGAKSDQDYGAIVAGWQLAVAALGEALAFVPEDADEAPDTAFWTETGRRARADDPGRFTRRRLEDDLGFFQRNLDDVQHLHD